MEKEKMGKEIILEPDDNWIPIEGFAWGNPREDKEKKKKKKKGKEVALDVNDSFVG